MTDFSRSTSSLSSNEDKSNDIFNSSIRGTSFLSKTAISISLCACSSAVLKEPSPRLPCVNRYILTHACVKMCYREVMICEIWVFQNH